MTAAASIVLLVLGAGTATYALCRGSSVRRLVALELLSAQLTCLAVLLAASYGRSSYLDVAMLLALLSFAGSLVFARFLGRDW